MAGVLSDTLTFADLLEVADLLLKFDRVRLRITSRSMVPALRPDDEIVVRPVPLEQLRVGDIILFEHNGQLICHRLVEKRDEVTWLTRGDDAGGPGEQVGQDQVLGKVVAVRKRGVWLAAKDALQRACLPFLLRWLPRLQRLKAYRVLIRPLVSPFLSYRLGLAQGARWYNWQELQKDKRLPLLPRSGRPHLLIGKRGKDVVGWSVLSFRNSEWWSEDVYVRLRYRGLGVETDLARVAGAIANAQ